MPNKQYAVIAVIQHQVLAKLDAFIAARDQIRASSQQPAASTYGSNCWGRTPCRGTSI
jgi:hypothetical protein